MEGLTGEELLVTNVILSNARQRVYLAEQMRILANEDADRARSGSPPVTRSGTAGPAPGGRTTRASTRRENAAAAVAAAAEQELPEEEDSPAVPPFRGRGRGRGGRGGRGGGRAAAETRRREVPPRSAARRQGLSGLLQFDGNRLQVRQGDEVVDVTADAYFPDSDDDRDWNGRDSEADDAVELPARATRGGGRGRGRGRAARARPRGAAARAADSNDQQPPRVARGRGRGRVAGQTREQRDAQARNGRSEARAATGPYVSGRGRGRNATNAPRTSGLINPHYIERLLGDVVQEQHHSLDAQIAAFYQARAGEPTENPFADLLLQLESDAEDGGAESDGTIELGSSSDEDDYGDDPLESDGTQQQPLRAEDRSMYSRELALWRAPDDRPVPDEVVPTYRGKPIEPDSTWGDCTMCLEPPRRPMGCTECLQFVGCSSCVNRWHVFKRGLCEGSTCPLCRKRWPAGLPCIDVMKKIDKKKEARLKKEEAKREKERIEKETAEKATAKPRKPKANARA